MSPAQRRIDPGLVRQLLAAPHRYRFFQALRLIERVLVRQGVDPEQAVPLWVRFGNTLSLSFPATELAAGSHCYSREGVRLDSPQALEQALASGSLGQVHLTPLFMGLLGNGGVLPLHYSETLLERETYLRDDSARAFLDIFTNRAVALYYAAWKKHRLAVQYEQDRRQRFVPLLLALAGLGGEGLRERLVDGQGDVFDEALAHYAALIGQRPVSAVALRRLLADYFQVPITLEPFCGAWYQVPPEQTSRLGTAHVSLGATALAGARVWQRDLRMRMRIGPLSRQGFEAFLPGGAASRALAKWLGLLTGGGLEYEVCLVLRAQDVAGAGLGETTPGARLGWDSYLLTRTAGQARSDTRYFIRPLS